MRLTGNFEKKFGFFFSIFSFLRAFVVSSCKKVVFESFWALDMAPNWAVPGLLLCVCVQNSALYYAASLGDKQMSEILINAGCDVNHVGDSGYTALMAAAEKGFSQCCDLYIKRWVVGSTCPNTRPHPQHPPCIESNPQHPPLMATYKTRKMFIREK